MNSIHWTRRSENRWLGGNVTSMNNVDFPVAYGSIDRIGNMFHASVLFGFDISRDAMVAYPVAAEDTFEKAKTKANRAIISAEEFFFTMAKKNNYSRNLKRLSQDRPEEINP